MPKVLEDGSVLFAPDEWANLTDPMPKPPGQAIEDVYDRLQWCVVVAESPEALSREWWNRVAGALVKAGLPSTDVPPSDLPEKIKQLGELREQALHQARTLAGDVADLTNRLDDELPTIFDTCLDELADARAAAQVEIQAEDIHEVGIAAYRLALRLVTDHELRERDHSRRPHRLDCECDPTMLALTFPGHGGVWTCPHGNRWRDDGGTMRRETDAEYLADHPIRLPSAFTADVTVDGGTDYFHSDGATRVVGQDGLTAAERAVDRDPSPVLYRFGAGVTGIEDIVTYDERGTATSLWGLALDSHHPTVRYVADSLTPAGVVFSGCDGSDECIRKVLGQIIRSKLHGVEQGTAGHSAAVERIVNAIIGMTDPNAPARISVTSLRTAVTAALTSEVIFPTRTDA